MPPQDQETSDSESDSSLYFGQPPNGLEDMENNVPRITDEDDQNENDQHDGRDDDDDEDEDDQTLEKNRKSTRKLARFSDKVEIIQGDTDADKSIKGRGSAAIRSARKGRGSRADNPRTPVTATGNAEDDDVDADDSEMHRVHKIVSRLKKKAEENHPSGKKGKRPTAEVAEEDVADEVPKPAKRRGRPRKIAKQEEADQVASKSPKAGPGSSRSMTRASREDSTPLSNLKQASELIGSSLKRKGVSKAGAEGSPRRSARAAALADKAAKAQAADDKKAKETRDATPAPKRRRSTVKKRGANKKDEKQDVDKSGVYVVEKIVGHRIDKKTGESLYEVKWKNYPNSQNTWEPRGNLDGCAKILNDYLATIN
ncbi:hypothetical protein PG999_011665 [Apiospora kogelbergensis]|uniref:Chromo domain-containing protein n=1 Tax=Apiospora kogelbergensis TaxID=1337665 RepID=A0AAW0QHT5_9PEZI